MSKAQNSKQYDLEERTFVFAANVRTCVAKLTKTNSNIEDSKQLIRSSGSVAANYIEANESVSKKDFIYRIKICRKEAKESRLFLRLLDTSNKTTCDEERVTLIQEASELTKIFGAILVKSESINKTQQF
jgi:four helix bundle protein